MDEGADLDEIEKRIKPARMPKEARKKAEAELKKLKLMSPMSAEATVVRNYIDTLVSLPWKKKSKISTDLGAAEKVLDEDHYGLEKVKERIVEYLAVQQRVDKLKAPDPVPGRRARRGQDLARPVDRARDQPQVRAHVAGRRARRGRDPRPPPHLHRLDAGQDPAEHEQGRRAQSAVPARRSRQDGHGFPRRSGERAARSARSRAEPHLRRPLRRSRVRPLRRDVRRAPPTRSTSRRRCSTGWKTIRLSGYTEDEKVHIALQHLLPKLMKNHGLKPEELIDLRERGARHHPLLHARSRRAGARARAVQDLPQGGEDARAATGEERKISVTARNLDKYLGVRRYTFGMAEKKNQVGQVVGPGVDRSRRRAADDRVGDHGRQGQDDHHRQAGRSHAGVGAGGAVGGAQPLEAPRHPGRLLPEERHPHPPAGRRDAQGRSERRASASAPRWCRR